MWGQIKIIPGRYDTLKCSKLNKTHKIYHRDHGTLRYSR